MNKTGLFLAALAWLWFSFAAGAQAFTVYDVLLSGKAIGTVKVLPAQADGGAVKRYVEARFYLPFYSGSFFSENHFTSGTLVSATTRHLANGREKEKTQTLCNGPSPGRPSPGYHVRFFGNNRQPAGETGKDPVLSAISHTITGLYYEEPVNITQVYSERYGEMCGITQLPGNRYRVKLPDSKTSVYSYSMGQCRQVELEVAGFKLKIVRRGELIVQN